MIHISLPRPARLNGGPRKARINSAPQGWWYAARVGEIVNIEFIDSEGYWAREGGEYNCINKIRPQDATLLPLEN